MNRRLCYLCIGAYLRMTPRYGKTSASLYRRKSLPAGAEALCSLSSIRTQLKNLKPTGNFSLGEEITSVFLLTWSGDPSAEGSPGGPDPTVG